MSRSSENTLFRHFFVPFRSVSFRSVSFCICFVGLVLMGAFAPTSWLFLGLTTVFGVSLFEKSANGAETSEDFAVDFFELSLGEMCETMFIHYFWALYVVCFAITPGLLVAMLLFSEADLAVQNAVIFSSVFLVAPILVLSGMLNDGSPFNLFSRLDEVFATTRENWGVWLKYYSVNIAFLVLSATTLGIMLDLLTEGAEANQIGSRTVLANQIAFGTFLTCSTFFYSRFLGRFAAVLVDA